MTDQEFSRWAKHHMTLFGLSDRRDLDMLASWRRQLERLGFSEAELAEASERVALDPPGWKGGMLAALRRAVESMRHVARMRAAAQRKAESEIVGQVCEHCGGVGQVIVPHRLDVSHGVWVAPYRTFAVRCDCSPYLPTESDSGASGERERHPPQLTLSKYVEWVMHDWKQQMKARDDMLAAEANLMSQCPGPLDRVLGDLRRKWQDRQGG